MKQTRTKLITVAFFAAIATSAITTNAIAQEKGDMAIGANIAINGGNVAVLFGYGVKAQYNVTDNIRLEPSYTHYNKAELDVERHFDVYLKSWECGINAHYLVKPTETDLARMPWIKNLVAYSLAGLGLMNLECSGSEKSNKSNSEGVSKTFFGLNLGVGMDLKLSNCFSLNFQTKYMIVSAKIEDYDASLGGRSMIHLGVTYRF